MPDDVAKFYIASVDIRSHGDEARRRRDKPTASPAKLRNKWVTLTKKQGAFAILPLETASQKAAKQRDDEFLRQNFEAKRGIQSRK